MKYSGVKLTKCVQNLYAEKYKKLMKEIKNIKKGKTYCDHVRLNIIKMLIFHQLVSR